MNKFNAHRSRAMLSKRRFVATRIRAANKADAAVSRDFSEAKSLRRENSRRSPADRRTVREPVCVTSGRLVFSLSSSSRTFENEKCRSGGPPPCREKRGGSRLPFPRPRVSLRPFRSYTSALPSLSSSLPFSRLDKIFARNQDLARMFCGGNQ